MLDLLYKVVVWLTEIMYGKHLKQIHFSIRLIYLRSTPVVFGLYQTLTFSVSQPRKENKFLGYKFWSGIFASCLVCDYFEGISAVLRCVFLESVSHSIHLYAAVPQNGGPGVLWPSCLSFWGRIEFLSWVCFVLNCSHTVE